MPPCGVPAQQLFSRLLSGQSEETKLLNTNWLVCTSTVLAFAIIARPDFKVYSKTTREAVDARRAVAHYIYFDREPIIPYTIEQIEKKPGWRYELSREDTVELYWLLRNPGDRSAYNWRFTRLIIDRNPWGLKTLVARDGHVKMGSRQYRITSAQLRALRKFVFSHIQAPPR